MRQKHKDKIENNKNLNPEIMKTFEKNTLSISELYSIRGGVGKGTTMDVDEDILLPDPEPED